MSKTTVRTSGRRCAIYIRVSSGGQEDGYSLETQEARCRAHAETQGFDVLGVFHDVHTGAEWRERPGLSQLRQAVRSGELDVVLAFALDRLSRKQTHVAILADEFLKFFDGFSIGSNDLTQLTLGLDRDSGLELLAADFDERDPAVKALLSRAIAACKAAGKYVGICGQGPSDHPDFAQWLADEGIVSISLNPDSVIDTWKQLAQS